MLFLGLRETLEIRVQVPCVLNVNFKPMQLFSQTSAASYLSFHLHENLKINQAIHEPVDVLAGGTCLFFFFFNLKIEISLVEKLILDAKVWSSDYSSSPSLIKCN